jgi:hypothetical protein
VRWWSANYADIRDSIRRHGRLDVVESLAFSDGYAHNHNASSTPINPDVRNPWPIDPTLQQRRALRRDTRRRRILLERQARLEQERWKVQAQAAVEEEKRRKHLLAIQARQERERVEQERRRAERANAMLPPLLLTLLRMPVAGRTPEIKYTLARLLEQELVRRGAHPIKPLDQETATMFAALDEKARMLMKHDWLMANLDDLWKQYPPAPVL